MRNLFGHYFHENTEEEPGPAVEDASAYGDAVVVAADDDGAALEGSMSAKLVNREWRSKLLAPSMSSHMELPGPQVLNHSSAAAAVFPHTISCGCGLASVVVSGAVGSDPPDSSSPDAEPSPLLELPITVAVTPAVSKAAGGGDWGCNWWWMVCGRASSGVAGGEDEEEEQEAPPLSPLPPPVPRKR